MTAIDTNIIIRLLTHDDHNQFQKAKKLMSREEIFIPDTVILETEWVLRFAYNFKKHEVCSGLRKLFGLPNIVLQNADIVALALNWYKEALDFADAFHLAYSQHCSTLATFDKKFIKAANGLSSCSIQRP